MLYREAFKLFQLQTANLYKIIHF